MVSRLMTNEGFSGSIGEGMLNWKRGSLHTCFVPRRNLGVLQSLLYYASHLRFHIQYEYSTV